MLDNINIAFIIYTMSDYQGLQSEKSAKADAQLEAQLTNDHSNFGPLGKSIFESLPIGVVAFNADLKIIEANPQAAKLIELDDYIDKSLAKAKDTDNKMVLDWAKQLKSALSTGKTRKFDNIKYTFSKDGKTKTKLLRIVCTPQQPTKAARNLAGTIIIEDITEKFDIERQLANAQKLATVGKLASKVVHELNNPMDGILRYINLAMRIIEQENLEKPKEYLTHCRQGIMRMVQIVSELLEFSRSTYAPLEYAKIEQIIEDAIKTMDMKTKASKIRILRNYASDIPQIRSGNLFQVFCNLIKNALDSMPDGGELSISTRLAADNTTVAEFHDTGTGFEPEHAEAIFEPFFTTKDKGKGTGLGLAICRDIIERYHGRITAENAPGGGSIFTIHLPAAGENS